MSDNNFASERLESRLEQFCVTFPYIGTCYKTVWFIPHPVSLREVLHLLLLSLVLSFKPWVVLREPKNQTSAAGVMPAALVAWVKGLLGADGGLLSIVNIKQAK